jgi:trehalose 6-phosphate synthase
MRNDLIVVTNRLPVRCEAGDLTLSDGGLVAALRPALRDRAVRWVGWDGGSPLPARIAGEPGLELAPLALSPDDAEGYYGGFCNRTLWPLLHALPERSATREPWWHAYRRVNERFGARAASLAGDDAAVWVHDFHLCLVPALLRAGAPRLRVGYFHHVPFPAPELWRRVRGGDEILAGMLGADAVGFQTSADRASFGAACRDAGVAAADDAGPVLYDGRVVELVVHPVGIDADAVARDAGEPATRRLHAELRVRFAGRRLLLGVDRLDYTKGIVERLRAFASLLERRPDLRERVVLLQIAVPSRGDVPEYRAVREEVEALVGRINGEHTPPGGEPPVHYLHQRVPLPELAAFYAAADVCLVTPLRDGMNLVAKEYVAVQRAVGGDGVLVLSRFAGAAEALAEAVQANPFHVEDLRGALERALALDPLERRRRLHALARRVATRDAAAWARDELALLVPPAPTPARRPVHADAAAALAV